MKASRPGTTASTLSFSRLVLPYWKPLGVAFVAMLATAAADLLEPWPLKVIFDYVIALKPMPPALLRWPIIGQDRLMLLNIAGIAVIVIAIIGAISSFWEKYLSTSVGQR